MIDNLEPGFYWARYKDFGWSIVRVQRFTQNQKVLVELVEYGWNDTFGIIVDDEGKWTDFRRIPDQPFEELPPN